MNASRLDWPGRISSLPGLKPAKDCLINSYCAASNRREKFLPSEVSSGSICREAS